MRPKKGSTRRRLKSGILECVWIDSRKPGVEEPKKGATIYVASDRIQSMSPEVASFPSISGDKRLEMPNAGLKSTPPRIGHCRTRVDWVGATEGRMAPKRAKIYVG